MPLAFDLVAVFEEGMPAQLPPACSSSSLGKDSDEGSPPGKEAEDGDGEVQSAYSGAGLAGLGALEESLPIRDRVGALLHDVRAEKLSYIIGYGDSFPRRVHHRGAFIPADVNTGCDGQEWLESSKPNPNVGTGALVGGSFKNNSYADKRENVMQNKATTYISALIVSLLSVSYVAQSLS